MASIDVWLTAQKDVELQANPLVNLWLKVYGGDEGKVFLSPDLMTDVEIDCTVNDLISQLKRARKKAKEKLANAKM